MELSMQTQTTSWLRCILNEIARQEETSEAIVPDTEPDIDRIIDSYAVPMLREKELRDGSLSIYGEIHGGIIYIATQDLKDPRYLEFHYPFSIKINAAGLNEHSQVICELKASSVDGKVINSRKALLRTNLACHVSAYAQNEQVIYHLLDQPDNIRVKQETYNVELPLEAGERSFTVSDSIDFPSGAGVPKKLCNLKFSTDILDKKIVGARSVFRGIIRCKLSYLTTESRLVIHEVQLPFSHFCDLQCDYDEDEQLQITPIVTGYDYEPESQDETSRGYLNVNLLAQCVVFGKKRLSVIEDAFSTVGVFVPEWTEITENVILDHSNETKTIHHGTSVQINRLLDTSVYSDYPHLTRKDGICEYTIPVSFHMMGYDHEDNLCSACEKLNLMWKTELSPNATVSASARHMSEYVSLSANRADIRIEFEVQETATSNLNLRMLCGGDLEKDSGTLKRPAIILRRVSKGTSLWDIAKATRSNEQIIQAVNSLDRDYLSEDKTVLIPIG